MKNFARPEKITLGIDLIMDYWESATWQRYRRNNKYTRSDLPWFPMELREFFLIQNQCGLRFCQVVGIWWMLKNAVKSRQL